MKRVLLALAAFALSAAPAAARSHFSATFIGGSFGFGYSNYGCATYVAPAYYPVYAPTYVYQPWCPPAVTYVAPAYYPSYTYYTYPSFGFSYSRHGGRHGSRHGGHGSRHSSVSVGFSTAQAVSAAPVYTSASYQSAPSYASSSASVGVGYSNGNYAAGLATTVSSQPRSVERTSYYEEPRPQPGPDGTYVNYTKYEEPTALWFHDDVEVHEEANSRDGRTIQQRAIYRNGELESSSAAVEDNRPSPESLQVGTNYSRDGRLRYLSARNQAPPRAYDRPTTTQARTAISDPQEYGNNVIQKSAMSPAYQNLQPRSAVRGTTTNRAGGKKQYRQR